MKRLVLSALLLACVACNEDLNTFELELQGDGSGTVFVDGLEFDEYGEPFSYQIECDTSCTLAAAEQAALSLEALPDEGSNFLGWGGDSPETRVCAGLRECDFTLHGDTSLVVQFSQSKAVLDLVTQPNANLNIEYDAAGTVGQCNGDCPLVAPVGAAIALRSTTELIWKRPGVCDGLACMKEFARSAEVEITVDQSTTVEVWLPVTSSPGE